jgi:hypothetical protein
VPHHASTDPVSSAVDLTARTVEAHGHRYRLQVAECRLITRLGGKPWTADMFSQGMVDDARTVWAELARAVGIKSARWFTDGTTNTKLGKSGFPSYGITFHADRSGGRAWQQFDPALRANIAAVFATTVEDIGRALDVTVCPHATSCRNTCVTDTSAHAKMANSQRTRLLRDVFMFTRPDLALAMTADLLASATTHAGGRMHARWRVNVSDDIRWEAIAPGLMKFAPAAYTYTKWPIAMRPSVPGLNIVYSADETWTDDQIVAACRAGLRVAVVFNVAKGNLPLTWHGVDVSNGDNTDDLYEHPAGTIVGLRVKAPTIQMKMEAAASGFARVA